MNRLLPAVARDYLDLVNAIVTVLDKEGRIAFASERLCSLLGASERNMIGKNWFDHFIQQEHKEKAIKAFQKIHSGKTGLHYKYEIGMPCTNGATILIEWQYNLLKDVDGNTSGVLLSGEDVTEKYILKQFLATRQVQSRKEQVRAALEAAEGERGRIAQELHDGVTQVLTVCKLFLENDMLAGDSSTAREVAVKIQAVIDDIRALSHRLRPGGAGIECLCTAVKQLIREINATGCLHVALRICGARFLKQAPPTIALNLFRILQEALNNIVKHAGASEAVIELYAGKDTLELEIRDNGKGFQRRSISGGLGLKTIYARAESVEGMAYIASAPGEGTLLSVYIPLVKSNMANQP